jgi:hypothetical protein
MQTPAGEIGSIYGTGSRRCALRSERMPGAARGGSKMEPIGRKRWAISPSQSSFSPRTQLICHETGCIFNAGDRDAHVRITAFFSF